MFYRLYVFASTAPSKVFVPVLVSPNNLSSPVQILLALVSLQRCVLQHMAALLWLPKSSLPGLHLQLEACTHKVHMPGSKLDQLIPMLDRLGLSHQTHNALNPRLCHDPNLLHPRDPKPLSTNALVQIPLARPAQQTKNHRVRGQAR